MRIGWYTRELSVVGRRLGRTFLGLLAVLVHPHLSPRDRDGFASQTRDMREPTHPPDNSNYKPEHDCVPVHEFGGSMCTRVCVPSALLRILSDVPVNICVHLCTRGVLVVHAFWVLFFMTVSTDHRLAHGAQSFCLF